MSDDHAWAFATIGIVVAIAPGLYWLLKHCPRQYPWVFTGLAVVSAFYSGYVRGAASGAVALSDWKLAIELACWATTVIAFGLLFHLKRLKTGEARAQLAKQTDSQTDSQIDSQVEGMAVIESALDDVRERNGIADDASTVAALRRRVSDLEAKIADQNSEIARLESDVNATRGAHEDVELDKDGHQLRILEQLFAMPADRSRINAQAASKLIQQMENVAKHHLEELYDKGLVSRHVNQKKGISYSMSNEGRSYILKKLF
ncbi:MAG: hypothetical protein ACR2PG_07320 [Hyphomicrobiaceae bacterium]